MPSGSMPLVEDPTQPELVRELVQAGRDAGTGGYDFDQGFRKHLALIASGAPTPPWAEGLNHGAPSAASTGLIGWLTGSAVGLALVSATWFMLQSPEAAPAAKPQVSVGPQVSVAPPAPVGSRAAPVAAAPVAADARATLSESSRSTRAQRERSSATSSSNPQVRHADRRSAAAPLGKPRSAENAGVHGDADLFAQPQPPESAQRSESARGTTDSAQPVVAPAAEATAPQEDGKLEREMAMLSMTQRVLMNDPSRALSLARQGEAEFPGSMFTQERQQLLLLALVKLGKVDDARRLAKPFLQRFPAGPFSDRVRRALAAGSVGR